MKDTKESLKCRKWAKNSVLWPGLSLDIHNLEQQCRIIQFQPENSCRPALFILWAMTPTKNRYAPIEEKAPVLTWAYQWSWEYIMNKLTSVETDYKFLVLLLITPMLVQLPLRIQRFNVRLMRFHCKEIKDVVPRKKMYIAVALSTVKTWSQAMTLTIMMMKIIHTLEAWSHHCLPEMYDYSRS